MKRFASCLLIAACLPGCHRLLPMQQDARDQAVADRAVEAHAPAEQRSPDLLGCAGSGSCRPVRPGQASAGMLHGCAIDGCGALWCWGRNDSGQLGLGDYELRSRPARVGTDTDWQSVSAGEASTCAIKTGGSLWCWGAGWAGQLGIGSLGAETGRNAPVRVGTATNWREVSVGRFHACGIRQDQALWCWGQNTDGELGADLTSPNVLSPVPVTGGASWLAVAARSYTCGVKTDHSLYCWGPNWICADLSCTTKAYGILGVGSTAAGEPLPRGLGAGISWQSVSVGKYHACAITSGGKLWCWGADDSGQAGGAGAAAIVKAPLEVAALSDVAQVGSGWFHTCARRGATREVWCFGRNEQLALGTSATVYNSVKPVQVVGSADVLAADFITVGYFNCAERNGTLTCWGNNSYPTLKYYPDSGVAHPDGFASSETVTGILGIGDTTHGAVQQPSEICLALPKP